MFEEIVDERGAGHVAAEGAADGTPHVPPQLEEEFIE
jgi:hypothetical protein